MVGDINLKGMTRLKPPGTLTKMPQVRVRVDTGSAGAEVMPGRRWNGKDKIMKELYDVRSMSVVKVNLGGVLYRRLC
jgi:hypothetical protein